MSFPETDLYYMQGNIHLSQFRNRVKSNRSGGEDDLSLAIEHFRVRKFDTQN